MALPRQEDFAGALADLTTPWTQMLTAHVKRNGGGKCTSPDGLGLARFDGGESWPNAQYSKIKFYIAGGGQLGTAVLLTGSGAGATGYALLINGGSAWTIYKVTAEGSYTGLVGPTTQAVTDGDYVELRSDGAGNVTSYLNGVQINTAADATYSTGQPGVFQTGTEGDDWEGGAVGGGGGPAFLAASPLFPRMAVKRASLY